MNNVMSKSQSNSPHKEYSPPPYLVSCPLDPCAEWCLAHPKDETPAVHWHCVHPICPTRGILGDKLPFCSTRLSWLRRHEIAHVNAEAKMRGILSGMWKHVDNVAGSLGRSTVEKHQTQLRRRLPASVEAAGEATSWRSRLLIGKTGDAGRILSSSIERFGVCPSRAIRCIDRIDHDPATSTPKPGQIIRFNPVGGEDHRDESIETIVPS